ncbi:MAG TPA: glycosyltransferase family A protein [Terriglobales bacterium]
MLDQAAITNLSQPRYALVTPVRDEEKFVGAMIDSIVAQTVRPARWIIVDDGSTDATPEIIESYAERFDFIEMVRLPPRHQRLAGGEGAVTCALRQLDLKRFDYLARFDADLLFSPNYISQILREFDRDPKLGIAGGGLYNEIGGALKLERDPDHHVRGALKMYRRLCFEDIGGLATQIGWDTMDEVYAWTKGWKSKSFYGLKVIHRRPTGGGIEANRVYQERGKAEYLTWSHPVFVLAKAVKTALAERSILKPVCYLAGFVACYLRGERRIQDPVFAKMRRDHQLNRLALPTTL